MPHMISRIVIGNDRVWGKVILILTSLSFVYYVTWILILPVLPLEPDSRVRNFFPEDNIIGIAVPVMTGTMFFTCLSLFACLKMRIRKSADKQQ